MFRAVTANGPAVAFTVSIISSELFAEPPALLSRTVNLKFIVLATDGKASTVISVPAVVVAPVNTEAILGKYLTGEVLEEYDLKVGPEVFVALAAELAPVCELEALSNCSQLYVKASPLASVPAPVNINGVLLGIV